MESDLPEHTAIRDRTDTTAIHGTTTPWTLEEVSSAICKLRTGRAPGMDRVEVAVVKACEEAVTPYLHQLSVDCLNAGYFPVMWKKARVCAFLKTGRPADRPSSYRMISLLPVLGKTLEQLILMRLRTAIDMRLLQGQYGGMPGRSTTHAIRHIMELTATSRARYVAGVFFDVKKAFDRMWWPAVLDCLAHLGVESDLRALVAS